MAIGKDMSGTLTIVVVEEDRDRAVAIVDALMDSGDHEVHVIADPSGLARKIADNASLSNYVMIQGIARIEDMAKADGFFAESLCAALAQTSPDAVEGLAAFLEKRAPQFR